MEALTLSLPAPTLFATSIGEYLFGMVPLFDDEASPNVARQNMNSPSVHVNSADENAEYLVRICLYCGTSVLTDIRVWL